MRPKPTFTKSLCLSLVLYHLAQSRNLAVGKVAKVCGGSRISIKLTEGMPRDPSSSTSQSFVEAIFSRHAPDFLQSPGVLILSGDFFCDPPQSPLKTSASYEPTPNTRVCGTSEDFKSSLNPRPPPEKPRRATSQRQGVSRGCFDEIPFGIVLKSHFICVLKSYFKKPGNLI